MRPWVDRQRNDQFVRRRDAENLVARSYFKIEEIFHKYFKSNRIMRILDLGSAPGGWSQFFKKHNHYVIGIDLLPMQIAVDQFYQQDILESIPSLSNVHMICSDIAPNLSGNKTVDNAVMCEISLQVIKCIEQYLQPKGDFVMKVFMGDSFNKMHTYLKKNFKEYHVFKPESSRSESSEIYLIGKGYISK